MNDGINNPPPKAIEMGTTAKDFQNLHELVAKARANLNQNAWDYIVGGTETETTLRRNRMALDEIAFRPRVLRDVSKVDASVQVMGHKLRLPVMLAPVGALESFDPGAGGAVVRGAGSFGAAHMLSSVSDPGLEKTAEAAPDAMRNRRRKWKRIRRSSPNIKGRRRPRRCLRRAVTPKRACRFGSSNRRSKA